ncbi:MAG: Uma2 family endonuclease [Pyrinomonadaceae bacterium]|nr:Uma2 family endonuclease [Pyrinomonadaceae bacterium]
MSVTISTIETRKNHPSAVSADAEIYYPDTDETIMPEGIQHFLLSVHLASILLAFFASRNDAKVFGNVMLYYEEGKPKKFVSPDLMVCFGLEQFPKRVYKLWQEKVVPSVVIEFASNTTWLNDVSSKLALYQKLGVKEYYVYDVEYAHLPEPLMAFRLEDGVLSEIEVRDKRILSESLGLELVDTGETLRFCNPETNEFLMTMEEMAAELALLKAEKQNGGK